jgi:hypothetical protein
LIIVTCKNHVKGREVLPDETDTGDLGTTDGHIVLAITSQGAQLHEW